MQRAIWVALGTGGIITGAAAISIGAVVSEKASPIGRIEYQAALAGIEAARPQVMARCERAAPSEREACRAGAEADEALRVAQLDAGLRGTQSSARNVQRTRIEARYQVERTKCAALGGARRDGCLIAAHALRGRALLEAAAPYEARS
jgi:hypothetical protein